MKDELDKNCGTASNPTGTAKMLQNIYTLTEDYFCKDPCYCKGTPPPGVTGLVWEADYTVSTSDPKFLVSSFSECTTQVEAAFADYEISVSDLTGTVFDFFKDLEEKFNCAGICYTYQIYVYSDVTQGAPTANCREGFEEEWNSKACALSLLQLRSATWATGSSRSAPSCSSPGSCSMGSAAVRPKRARRRARKRAASSLTRTTLANNHSFSPNGIAISLDFALPVENWTFRLFSNGFELH